MGPVPLKVRLKPGQSRAYRVKVAVPMGLAPGSYQLSATLSVGSLGDSNPTDGNAAAAAPLHIR